MNYEVKEVSGSDGKCPKCNSHCMKCDCWISDLNFITEKEMEELRNNQPERSKREDVCKAGHYHKGRIEKNSDSWKCDICGALIKRCGALNSMET